MTTIAKVIESMLSTDTPPHWKGLPEEAGPCGSWSWGGAMGGFTLEA